MHSLECTLHFSSMSLSTDTQKVGDNIDQRCVGKFSQKIMQVLIPCLIFLAVENVQLVQNEHLEAQEVLDSTQFKNAVAKELLKKKLSTLESARQQDSLATFLRKGGKNLSGLRTAPKSSFHKDDDPSRKQAQMANTFIASSNLLFGTKSQQRKACNSGGKQVNKEGLDMQSLRQTHSGYNEDGIDFMASKEAPKLVLDELSDSISLALKKRSNPQKAMQDPISCYLTEPKKVTCMHKDIIYKIALPSSEVADDEIGRIVESIYRAVEGKSREIASLDESIEGAPGQKTSLEGLMEEVGSKTTSQEDSSKKKRASNDYLRSLFLNNLLVGNQKVLPNYNGNNQVFIPLLIPMTQPKLDPPRAPSSYYSGLAIDPRLQVPMNLTVGLDPVNNYQTDRNLMFENGYGQYLVPDGFVLPELNLKQRSQANLTAEEEKRRNWLALMATNGLVPVENGVNPKALMEPSAKGEVQSIAEEKGSLSNGNTLSVAEAGVVLDKLLNERHQRDTYFLRRQLRKKPITEEKPALMPFYGDGRKRTLTKVVQKLSDPGGYLWEEKKGCPCPCPCPSDSSDSSKGPRKPTKCAPKFPQKTNFLPTIAPASNGEQCCSPTTRCATTKCPVKCPDGCQPIPSSRCEPTSCNPCSKKSEMCEETDILSRVVSGSMNRNERPQINQESSLPPPLLASHQNWLPYSPQLIPQNQLQFIPHNQPHYVRQSHNSGQKISMTQEERNDEPAYFERENGELQHSEKGTCKDFQYAQQSNESQLASNQIHGNQQYSVPFMQQEQLQYPVPTNLVRNQIQVNFKQLPLDQGTNLNGYHKKVESTIPDMGSNMSEPQNKSISLVEHNITALRQNDVKTKKHRDSFFARLRSKFHKGIPPNGSDQENQYTPQNQRIQNSPVLGTSIFKFNPRNQTFGSGRNSTLLTSQTENQQQCSDYQNSQSNDCVMTLANKTQPSTVNNINITIASMQPHPGAQGQLNINNQTNQPPQYSRNNIQCPHRSPPTARAASNGQNSRLCKVTKIWLCSQRSSSNSGPPSNDSCTQETTCQTNQTTCMSTQTTTHTTPSTTSQTTSTTTSPATLPTTCQTTQSTCTTQPTTCKSTTLCASPSTQLSKCSESWNLGTSTDSQPSENYEEADSNTQPSTCATETPAVPKCASDKPPGSSQPPPEHPWSPSSSQMPMGMPSTPPDYSQGNPGVKIKTFYFGPNPVWSQWQYPVDVMNPHPPEQNQNWQHQPRVPLPTQFIPQVPLPKQPQSDPRVPMPTPFKWAHQKQVEHNLLPPMPPRHQAYNWNQNAAQPQMFSPSWQQAPNQKLELDPRWENIQSNFPNGDHSRNVQSLPIANEHQNPQRENANHYKENEWMISNKTTAGEATRETRKIPLPANIKQHIARIRRYLQFKRSKMSKRPIVTSR